jgi:hypothetical protein
MFNIEDKETIMKLIDCSSNDEVIIPIYISIGNKKYLIVDMDEIDTCSPSIFKIGFGSSDSVFIRNKFPKSKLINFSNSKVFSQYDEDKQCVIEYYVFESSDIEYDRTDLTNEINKWYHTLLDHVMEHVEIVKKERIRKTMEELS